MLKKCTKSPAPIILAALVGACLPSEDVAAVPAQHARTEPPPKESVQKLHDFSDAIATVSESAVPSVVNISTTRTVNAQQSPFGSDPLFRRFFEGPHGGMRRSAPRPEQSLGSGVIVRKDGVILTNNHVVQGADEIQVTLKDQRSYEAKLVGTDPKSDLAVLKLEKPPKDLVPIRFGDADKLRLGEVVVAIGNPFGVGQTVTMGIVSAKGRANIGIVDYEDFIQTDAAINPGNSGGALVNLRGELVGINTAILSRTGGYQGIGFAIPSDMAESIMSSLLEDGRVVRGWLGVMIQDLTPDLAKALDIEGTRGVLISDVVEDTPAEKAGLKAQDVILELEGERMETAAELRREVAGHRPGSRIEMKILRDGDEETVTVKLGEHPESEEAAMVGANSGDQHRLLLGLSLKTLDDGLRRRFEMDDDMEGAVVMAVDPMSPAARSGLRPGDVITSVNRESIDSVEDLRDEIGDGDQALLRVYRHGASMFVVLKK